MGRPAASIYTSAKGNTIYKFHGSVFGGCLHAQVEAMRGVEPAPHPPKVLAMFEAGHRDEERVKQLLRDRGLTLLHADSDYTKQLELSLWETVADKEYICLSSHTDSILQWDKMSRTALTAAATTLSGNYQDWQCDAVHEHKCLSTKNYNKFVLDGLHAFERYAWQTSAAMHGARKHFGNPNMPLLMTASCRDYDRGIAVQYFPQPMHSLQAIMARCLEVVKHYKDGTTPPCQSEYWCEYKAPISYETAPDVADAAAEFCDARAEVAYRERVLEEKRSRLIAALAGRSSVKAGDYTIRHRIDKRGVESLHCDGGI